MRVHKFIPASLKSAFTSLGLMLHIESSINGEDGSWITTAGENLQIANHQTGLSKIHPTLWHCYDQIVSVLAIVHWALGGSNLH